MELNEIRKYFPHIETGRIFLDHAATSPLSTRVIDRLNDYFHQRSVTHIENFWEYQPILDMAKNRLAKLINADEDRISWKDNVTNGLNMLAQSLDWKAGDRIILNDIEFPANVYPFINLISKGVIIDFAKSLNSKVDLEQIEPLVTERTKLISISQVQFLTGYRANLQLIGEFCKTKNIIFCVDAIQGVGAVTIDVKDSNIDYLVGGTQKWLMGLKGLGYIYITEELQNKINQSYVGWISVKNAWSLLDYNLDLLDNANRYQTGTLCSSAIAALEASLSLMEEIGKEKIENVIIDNSLYLHDLLKKNNYALLLEQVNSKNIAGIISFRANNPKYIFEELLKENINIALRENILRISPHFYNTKLELEFVVKRINELDR